MHTPEALRDVATGFVRWNAVRIAGCAVAALCAFGAFVMFLRDRATAGPGATIDRTEREPVTELR